VGQDPRTVAWTAAALEDLVETLERAATYTPGQEIGLYEDTMAAAKSLATLSERGRLGPELPDRRTREIFVRDYRLMYEVHPDRVAIVAFVFGRRDFAAWWRARRER
jgi:plasmid stabilization system protein ParE